MTSVKVLGGTWWLPSNPTNKAFGFLSWNGEHWDLNVLGDLFSDSGLSLEISRGCGLDRRNEWRKVLLAWDDTRC